MYSYISYRLNTQQNLAEMNEVHVHVLHSYIVYVHVHIHVHTEHVHVEREVSRAYTLGKIHSTIIIYNNYIFSTFSHNI